MTQEANTIWSPRGNQEGEYTIGSVNDIVDPLNNYLVDPSGNQIIDTGVVFNIIDNTVWANSPGA